MGNFIVNHKTTDHKGAFEATDAQGNHAGEMTYTSPDQNTLIIDHTGVEDAYNGQGVGMELLEALVAYAREQHLKVIPLCPYAKSRFDKYASLRDVL